MYKIYFVSSSGYEDAEDESAPTLESAREIAHEIMSEREQFCSHIIFPQGSGEYHSGNPRICQTCSTLEKPE